MTASTAQRLMWTMGLNFVITAAELAGGLISGSLSLISDALHNFSDGISVIISYIALKLKELDNSHRHTFGLKRAEIVAAVVNSIVLVLISLYLFRHAVLRLVEPKEIAGGMMIAVAAVGLAANVAGTLLLRRDSRSSMNIRSAYLHLLSDAVSSLGVILGGLAILFWNAYWVDPVLTILIGLYIIKESWEILTSALHVLIEGAPAGVSLTEIQKAVEAMPEVQDIHHVHAWTVSEGDIHFEAHVNVRDMLISRSCALKNQIAGMLETRFGINHATLQFECDQCRGTGLIKSRNEGRRKH